MAAPRPGPPLEPVSSRLKASLIHPNRGGVLNGLSYSPDGQRIIAGDSPGGVIQTWDAHTGAQLTKIEAGYGRDYSEYFFLAPDWQTVYVPRGERRHSRFERDGKELIRWEFDGDVRAWDLTRGELTETFRHTPPRNIMTLRLSPDGASFLTGDELSGEYELGTGTKTAATLWDVETRQHRSLPDGLDVYGCFSPDSKTIAMTLLDDDAYATAIKLFDVATAEERLSIPLAGNTNWAYVVAFSPDESLMVGQLQELPKRGERENWRCSLKFWDAATGQELAAFPAEEEESFFREPTFSPDGRVLAVTNWWRGEKARLYLFDADRLRLINSIDLTEKVIVRDPVFSPDGRWLAVITQVISDDPHTPAEDLPQPRIHLIDAIAAELRETLVAPQSIATCACFSPDGHTLATGGKGKVLLWDLSTPPGSAPASAVEIERHDR